FQRLGNARAIEVQLELARLSLEDGDVTGAARVMEGIQPNDSSPKRTAEIAQVTARLDRAAGRDPLAACRRAVELAERTPDDETLVPALVLYSRCLVEANENGAASRIIERAQQVDATLGRNVPEDAATAWSERPLRVELMSLVGRIASVWQGPRESQT